MTDYLMAVYDIASLWPELHTEIQRLWRDVAYRGLDSAVAGIREHLFNVLEFMQYDYLCGVGLELSYMAGRLVLDAWPGPVLLVHLHNMLLKGFSETLMWHIYRLTSGGAAFNRRMRHMSRTALDLHSLLYPKAVLLFNGREAKIEDTPPVRRIKAAGMNGEALLWMAGNSPLEAMAQEKARIPDEAAALFTPDG